MQIHYFRCEKKSHKQTDFLQKKKKRNLRLLEIQKYILMIKNQKKCVKKKNVSKKNEETQNLKALLF